MRWTDGLDAGARLGGGRVRRRRAVAAAGLLAVAAALAGCGSVDVTRPRLEGDVALSFSNLLVRKQELLGRPAPGGVQARASCAEVGPQPPEAARRGPDLGPGKEWSCTIRYSIPGQAAHTVGYRVQVRPDACWSATVADFRGEKLQPAGGGRKVLNPIYRFQGCLPT